MMTHFKKLLERFGKKNLLEQGVVLFFLVAAVIYGGTKPGNAPRMMMRSGDEVEEANGFSTNELAVGVVQIYVRSNEVWNFNPLPGATVIEKWRLRGAAYDWHHFDCTNFVGVVFSDGRLRLQERQPCCHNSAPFAHEIATGCCATLAMTAGGGRRPRLVVRR